MLSYIIKKIIFVIPVMFGVTILSFSMLHLAPGDTAEIIAGDEAGADVIEAIRKQYGLDKPLHIQYYVYISGLLHGNFGRSITTRQEIGPLLIQRLRVTIKLALFGLTISCVIGILAGVIGAVYQYSLFDTISMVLALFGASMPVFWFGLLLMMFFSVTFQLFPAGGGTDWHSLTLPAISISASASALIARMTRGSMLEVIRQDYLRTARANGINEIVIIYKHALKNAMIPIITVVGLYFGYMLAGAVITETVFAIPGVGTLLLAGIFDRDYPVVQSTMFMVATIFVIVNVLTDIAYAFFDPRVRYR
jgi:peptide/nickel transport system permease protein